jgi:probable HAF family extracellular repeat protein
MRSVLVRYQQNTDLGSLAGEFGSSGATAINDSGHSSAADINNSGEVIGNAEDSGSGSRAFLWQSGSGMQDLLGDCDYSRAAAINESGQIVGSAGGSCSFAGAFLYSGGQMLDLNTLVPANSGWLLSAPIDNQ